MDIILEMRFEVGGCITAGCMCKKGRQNKYCCTRLNKEIYDYMSCGSGYDSKLISTLDIIGYLVSKGALITVTDITNIDKFKPFTSYKKMLLIYLVKNKYINLDSIRSEATIGLIDSVTWSIIAEIDEEIDEELIIE